MPAAPVVRQREPPTKRPAQTPASAAPLASPIREWTLRTRPATRNRMQPRPLPLPAAARTTAATTRRLQPKPEARLPSDFLPHYSFNTFFRSHSRIDGECNRYTEKVELLDDLSSWCSSVFLLSSDCSHHAFKKPSLSLFSVEVWVNAGIVDLLTTK